ncbi:hypothetical protein BH23CHL5_BH23CHL5_08850 [soil metagenome]
MTTPAPARRLLVLGLMLVSLCQVVLQAPVSAQDEGTDPPDRINLELILDASGSMAEEIEPGVTRIDAAKAALNDVIDMLPQSERVNVGFRVYGHKGLNTEPGRAESCRSTELKVAVDGVDVEALRAEVDAYQPVGWTPLALSMTSSADDFPEAAESIVNATVVVTDGLETCGGNPCTASRQLKQGPKGVTTHVIGFALSADEQANLQCIVDESGGLLLGAGNADELANALFVVLGELEIVITEGTLEIESFGGVYPVASVLRETSSDTDDGVTQFSFEDSNLIDLPVGTYQVSWENPSGELTTLFVDIAAGQTTYIRGSLIRFSQGAGDIYILTAIDGTVIWEDTVNFGDAVWVLPGTYRLKVAELSATSTMISLDLQTSAGSVTTVSVDSTP